MSDYDRTIKNDSGKLRLTLVPREIIRAVAEVREYGVRKYTDCGAIVSFNNPKCDYEKGDVQKIRAWNRRADEANG